MKTKPISHKSENTFKFESFGHRLSQINISVLHNLKRRVNTETSDESISQFAITLEKWFDLNGSQHFHQLRQSIGSLVSVQSLPQIIVGQNRLIDILIENLRIKDNLAHNVVLELVVSLALDLNTDFYQYFDRILLSLIDLLDTTDTELIENIFVCLTFLFKYLWKYINKDFANNYRLFETLLKSKKDYIRKFTSESVSFLVRKAQNKSSIFDIIFESVAKDNKLIEGIGQLLYESVKGLNNDFHSSAQTFMSLLFDKYLNTENDNLDQTIGLMFDSLVEYISKQNSQLIWRTLLIDSDSKAIALKKVISLLKAVIGHKDCQLVVNASESVEYLIKYLDCSALDANDKNNILSSFHYLLFNCFQYLTPEDIKLINEKLFESDCLTIEQIFDFTKSVFNCVSFERNILPSILIFCAKQLRSDSYESNHFSLTIKLLVELILTKRRRPIYGTEVKTISKYVLRFDEDICRIFVDIVSTTCDPKMIWSAFVCLPNFMHSINEQIIIEAIVETLLKIESRRDANHSDNQWFGYIIVEAMTALIVLKSGNPINELTPKFFIDLINSNADNTEILQAFDLYLSFNKEFTENGLDLTVLEQIYSQSLEKNLSSFDRIKRLITLHILTLFDPPLPPSEDINSTKDSVFKICFKSESICADLREYRTKLKCLQNLDISFVKHSIPLTTSGGLNFEQMPIHYLFGALYENFSLLWQPIQKLISGYAKNWQKKSVFSHILFNHFRQTTEYINENNSFDNNYYQKDVQKYLNSDSFSSNTSEESLASNRPDLANHRLLLLKTMKLFGEVIEPSNREFVSLFFDFIDNEMSFHLIFGQNSRENIGIEDQLNDNQMEIDSNEDPSDKREEEKNKPTIGRKTLWKTLFSFLSVLSEFKNPKALYREKELLELYLNLLSCPDSEVQKNAFNCIATYNNSYLIEFKENFLRLIDEKTFKTEIYSFILNTESDNSVLKSGNRPNIVPILMRILYGKMLSTNGTKSHGKNRADFRRSIILKVLTAFDRKELILFLDFVFAPIIEFVRNDYKGLNETIKSKIDIKAFIPLHQFQALVRTLHFVLKHFGNNSEAITSYVYKVLVVVSTLATHLLLTPNRNSINDYSITRLKDIRCHCFKVAKSFFDTFDTYCYSSAEIDALFQSLIWPLLPHLDTESLSTPSPLLTLFICFSQNSRYFKLLAKSHPTDKELTPIKAIVKIYDNPKAQTPVICAVTQLIENLLVLDDLSDSNEQNLTPIEVNDTNIAINCNHLNEELSLGTVLLLPFTSEILNRIRVNSETNKKSDGKQKKKSWNSVFTAPELNILSRLSSYVTQSDESQKLILLLIQSIDVKSSETEKELQTLSALTHLVKNVRTEPNEVLKCLIPLFGIISNCVSRTQLCHTLKVLVENNTHLSSLSQLVSDMNAFNPKFPEEPDYPKRIEAFKAINAKIESISENEFNNHFISLIVYNCVHFIQFCNDLAIRESAGHMIRGLLKRLNQSNDNELFHMFAINLILYSTIAKGLRSKSETIRHNLIELMLSLIEICGHRHPVLQQLALLSNKEDEEIDFWLNIKHIQLHRRSRALSRLARNHDLLKTLSNRIITEFLIPLTTNFLIDIHYTKQTALLNASIEAIGAFSKYTQWSKYYFILKFYINQLIAQKGDQKINIRIICSLLDNYSFGSSQSNETIDMEVNEELEEEEEEEEVVANESTVRSFELESSETKPKSYDSILNRLLPLLRKCLHQKSQIDFSADSMKSEFPEDEEIQRVPIGLAVIKLLKSMNTSPEAMKTNTSSVFLRLCQFLQSRAQSIRDSARNTFVKVMVCLGPNYLLDALNQMRATLSKGYQRHVLVYTIHAILLQLKPHLKAGDLDKCLPSLLDVCSLELFGNLSEEKDVSKITTKLKEAKKTKSFDIFQIIAAFVSEKCLTQLLMPLRTGLLEAHNHKTLRKVSQSLSKVGQGLIGNSALTEKTLLLFTYGLINDIIPDLQLKYNDNKPIKKDKTKPMRVDSFLISKPIYQRTVRVTKNNETSNSHIMIEFGLNCFLALIKQKRMQASNDEHLSLVDPFIGLLDNLLESKDPKLSTLSLQSLYTLYTKFEVLPSFASHSENIMKTIFVLLNKYAKFGISDRDDDNVQLVLLSFKTLSLFIKDRTDVVINDQQMAVLLSYVDQDLHNDSRQSTVFIILKSILSRKYSSGALHRIMQKLAEMAITSPIDYIRNNCIELCVKYLTEYSNGLKKRINFFIRHLEYDMISGRESALTVLKQVLLALNYDYLQQNLHIIFVPLSSRLVNEPSSDCKKLVADSLIRLLKRITETDRNVLFNDLVVPWLQSESVPQRLLASHLCSLFLSVEEKDFLKRLPKILSFLRQQLDPSRYETSAESVDVTDERSGATNTDSLVFQHLNLFIKLMKVDSQLIKKSLFIDDVNAILDYLLSHHVLHPHLWVRVISTQIFGQLFSEYSTECLANSIVNPSESYEYLISETKQKLIQMSSKFCLIFRDIYESEVLSNQLIKNLVYISRVFIQSADGNPNISTFKWMLNKLIFEVKYELKSGSNSSLKRICVFKWMAAVAVELASERLEQFLPNFLPLLCREEANSDKLSNNEENSELSVLTKQVLQLFKNIIGTEKFSDYYTKAKTQMSLKRIERKKQNAVQSVNDVVRSAKRKIDKHNKSKAQKKRKISNYKRN